MEEDFFTETIEVTDYDNLVNVIKGKTDKCGDLRNKFVFRGVEDCEFKLVPSALREDDINDYVNENFKVTLRCPIEEVEEYGFEVEMLEFPDDLISIPLNKYFERVEEDTFEYIFSKSEFQFRKELDALLNFLDYGDKVGLKIPINQKIRKLIDRKIGKTFNYETLWPCKDFYELISLAQHYGIPTRALDWSYDYNVSLYFALKNILVDDYLDKDDNPSEGVLWHIIIDILKEIIIQKVLKYSLSNIIGQNTILILI